MTKNELVHALCGLLEFVDRNTCVHDDTHRAGIIWTVCDGCGMKWADDEGGFVPHTDAPEVARARAALSAALEAEQPVATGWDLVKGLENGTIALDDGMNPYRVSASPARSEQPVAVKVKPLEWEALENGLYRGSSTIGYYHVFPGTGFSYDLCGPVGGRLATHKRLESAKAAAQQDYETRIRSAIVEVAVEPVAWYRDESFTQFFSLGPVRPTNATSKPDEWKPLYAHALPSGAGDNDTVERVSTEAAMSQWERSLKRPDLSEKDRVRGAIEAYKRQAFAFAMLSSTRTASSADGSATISKGVSE